MSFKTRLILIFILASLVPMSALQVYIIGTYSRQQSQKISSLISNHLALKRDNLEREIADFRNMLVSLMTDDTFLDMVNQASVTDPEQRAWHINRMEAQLSQATYQKKGVVGIVYVNLDDDLLVNYNKYQINDSEVFRSNGGVSATIRAVEENRGGITAFSTSNKFGYSRQPYSITMIGTRFSDLNRTQWRGFIFLLIDERELHDLLNPSTSPSDEIFSYTFLRNQKGVPFSFENKAVFNDGVLVETDPLGFFMNHYTAAMPQGDLISRNDHFEKMGWTITTVFRSRELYGDISFFRLYTIAIGILSGILALFIVRRFIVYFADAVSGLRHSMTIENDQLHFAVSADNELEYLNRSFAMMKEKIDDLLQDQRERNVRLLEIQEERRQAEIRAIEAQVNPHFLYNTLNSLNWIAIERKDHQMSRALTDLAQILRYSISRIDTLTTIGDELKWLDKYLKLQQLRFDDLFEFRIRCAEDLGDFRIYKLLFQPYIENTLVHGFSGRSHGGQLDIILEQEEDDGVKITIVDNGTGFNPETVGGESFGLESSEYRMKLYYKGRAKVRYFTGPTGGTTVEIHIPEIKDENTHR